MQPIKKIKEKQERLSKELLIENDNFAKEIHPRLKKKKTFNRKPTLKNNFRRKFKLLYSK